MPTVATLLTARAARAARAAGSVPARAAQVLTGWPAASQHTACCNALLASTALSHRRREREEVEEAVRRPRQLPRHGNRR